MFFNKSKKNALEKHKNSRRETESLNKAENNSMFNSRQIN